MHVLFSESFLYFVFSLFFSLLSKEFDDFLETVRSSLSYALTVGLPPAAPQKSQMDFALELGELADHLTGEGLQQRLLVSRSKKATGFFRFGAWTGTDSKGAAKVSHGALRSIWGHQSWPPYRDECG